MSQCEYCGAHLDPGERCDCQDQSLALRCIQAPIIFEDLESVRRGLETMLAEVALLPADDDSLKRVKAIRAELSRSFGAMEQQRKEVKRQVMQPYTAAEEKYKANIADPYRSADQKLKQWVDGYQNGLKQQCEDSLREYFEELCTAQGVDFLYFSQCGIKVDMTMARQKEPKKAMDTIYDFVMKVRQDMDTILKLEDAAEILGEYQESLDLAQAIQKAKNRKALTAAMARMVREKQQEEAELAEILEETPELQVPEELYSMSFTVTGTLAALRALKAHILASDLTLEEEKDE